MNVCTSHSPRHALVRRAPAVLAVVAALGGAPTAPAGTFVEGWFRNSFANLTDPAQFVTNSPLTPSSASVWAGGHAGPVPAPGGEVPTAQFTIGTGSMTVKLVQSATGQMIAGPLGFGDASGTLRAEGFRSLTNSAAYARIPTLTSPLERPVSGWQIRFPGVLDPVQGTVLDGAGQNYDEALNEESQRLYEAALRINPFDQEAAFGVLSAVYHRIVPHTFAGNNALQRADRVRLLFGDLQQEISVIEHQAVPAFGAAADQMIRAFASQPAAGLLDGSYPHLALLDEPALTRMRRHLLASFARAVASQVEATCAFVRLRYLATYQSPLAPGFHPAPLLDLLDQRHRAALGQLLHTGMFAGVPAEDLIEVVRVGQALGALDRLRDSIANGRLSFVAVGSTAQAQSFGYREYPPEYVPFFRDLTTDSLNRDSSFDNLKTRAKELINWSVVRDEAAQAVSEAFLQDTYNLETTLGDLKERYSTELGSLCGLVRDEQGDLVPDILLALLSPEHRDARYAYDKAGETKGALYAQHRRIELAHDEVNGVILDLRNLISNLRKKEQIGREIAQGQENLAYLILANGEKLKALDLEQGEAEAEAAEKQGRNNTSAEMGVLAGAMTGAASGGWWGAAAGAASSYIHHQEAVKASENAGEIHAELARRLARIQVKRTDILTTQGAKIQFQVRDETLLRTEEAMHAMLLEAQRMKLNILLAEQRRDMERLELANMLGRAQFLVQEYVAAVQMGLANPRNSPDFRLVRDLTLRDAEDTFIHAQEWAFLAAKAAQYRENRQNESTQIGQLLRQVLAARNGQQLSTTLQRLESAMAQLIASLGGTQLDPAVISLRHDIFQKNIARYDADGDLDPLRSSLERTPAGTSSDDAWKAWLTNSVETLPNGSSRLVLRFATSLLRQAGASGRNLNPLYKPLQYNGLIFYRPGQGDYGVEINLRGKQLEGLSEANPPSVFLRQEGASYIRNTPASLDARDSGLMVWNLSRARLWQGHYQAAGELDPAERARTAETSTIKASWNNFKGLYGGARLHELSPANDRWVFILDFDETANRPLAEQLDRITDIEIRFSIRGF